MPCPVLSLFPRYSNHTEASRLIRSGILIYMYLLPPSWTVTTVSRYTCTVQAVHAVGCRCLRVTSAAAVPEQWLITWHGQALPADDCGIPSDDERMDAPACRLAGRGTSRSYHHDRAH